MGEPNVEGHYALCIMQGLTLSVLQLFVKQEQPDVKLVRRK